MIAAPAPVTRPKSAPAQAGRRRPGVFGLLSPAKTRYAPAMNATTICPLILALVGIPFDDAQIPPRVRPPLPPAERPPLSPAERPARTNERPHRAGWQQLPSLEAPAEFQTQGDSQIGLNFVRFFWDGRRPGSDPGRAGRAPDEIFGDLARLGATAYRQFVKADLLWDLVEPTDGQWTFSNADAVVPHAGFVPLPTLFAMQYASPTPPWETDPAKFRKTLGPEARRYLETVVRRYAPHVKYWELGNEMEHWRIADPGDGGLARARRSDRVPDARPTDGFSPREQGRFLAEAAAVVRANDPDAVIVLPGMAGLDGYSLETWLAGVVAGGGKDWFDVVNYHDYAGWESFALRRPRLTATLKKLGLDDKPVWLTETGSSSDPTLTLRTDYPNSPETQAADVFRRIVQAYGFGDSLVIWHCHAPGPAEPQNDWRGYGLCDSAGRTNLAGHAFRLLTSELVPWTKIERLAADPRGANVYRFTLPDGAVKTVAWGAGTCAAPAGATRFAAVAPAADGTFAWRPVAPGQPLPLSPIPVLIK